MVTGSWTGTMHYWVHASVGLASGDASGWIGEWFMGRTELHRKGTLWASGPFVVDGSTGIMTATLRITGTGGVFRRAYGTVDVMGSMPITTGAGVANYSGYWSPAG